MMNTTNVMMEREGGRLIGMRGENDEYGKR